MSILVPSTPVAGAPARAPDEVSAVRLEMLIDRLVAQQASDQIGYWAAFADMRGVSHYAFTTDPGYAGLSPGNAASRTAAVAAFGRAIERYCAMLESVCARLRGREAAGIGVRIVVRTLRRLALAVATLVILGNVFGIVLIVLGVGDQT